MGGWKPYAYIKPSFQTAFSRAVCGLMKRGLLQIKEEEKVVRRYRSGRQWIQHRYRCKQARYVTLPTAPG